MRQATPPSRTRGSRSRDRLPEWRERGGGEFVELVPPLYPPTADRLFAGWAREAELNRSQLRRDVRREVFTRDGQQLCRWSVRRRALEGAPPPPAAPDGPLAHELPARDMSAAAKAHDAMTDFAFGVLLLGIAYVAITLLLSFVFRDVGIGDTALRAMGIGALAIAYGVCFVSLVNGYRRRRERPPSFFAKQAAVLGASIPSVTLMTLAVLYADMSPLARFAVVLVYGSAYVGIVREFVELPPTRDEVLGTIRRLASPPSR